MPVVCLHRNGALRRLASLRSTPRVTSTPARRSSSTPPPASGCGSRAPTATRRIPASTIAVVHAGVFPRCEQGSRFTNSVAPSALSPACLSATTSACSRPNSSWNPSPTTRPSRTTTAPTSGLGATLPHPRSASSRARRMASRSAASTGSSETPGRAGRFTRLLRDAHVLCPARALRTARPRSRILVSLPARTGIPRRRPRLSFRPPC